MKHQVMQRAKNRPQHHNEKLYKLNNKGAAIVSVLVVTAFITVIATTLLYIAAQNYQQKQTDYQNKQSFYEAEEALDYLKAQLVKDVQQAYMEAYTETTQNMLYYGLLSESEYNKAFNENLVSIWSKRVSDTEGKTVLDAVRSLYTDEELSKCIYKVDGYGVSGDNTFVISGVRAKGTSGNYTTFLKTDICLNIPPYNRVIAEASTTTELTSDSSGEASGEAETETLEEKEKSIVALTDYVVYMNWRKADFDD